MKGVVAPLVFAVVLALAGTGFWLAGQTETRLADAHKRLATLQYSEAAAASDQVEQSSGLERRLPVVGPQSELEVRDLRAEARYWRTDYASLAPQRDAAGSLIETNPALQLVSANAAFRTTQQAADRLDAVRRLDTGGETYADGLAHCGRRAGGGSHYGPGGA